MQMITHNRYYVVSTHSRAEAAAIDNHAERANVWFQHTAARRRLLAMVCGTLWAFYVSTHSRAEAAARAFVDTANVDTKFQHTAARRRLHLHPWKK